MKKEVKRMLWEWRKGRRQDQEFKGRKREYKEMCNRGRGKRRMRRRSR